MNTLRCRLIPRKTKRPRPDDGTVWFQGLMLSAFQMLLSHARELETVPGVRDQPFQAHDTNYAIASFSFRWVDISPLPQAPGGTIGYGCTEYTQGPWPICLPSPDRKTSFRRCLTVPAPDQTACRRNADRQSLSPAFETNVSRSAFWLNQTPVSLFRRVP